VHQVAEQGMDKPDNTGISDINTIFQPVNIREGMAERLGNGTLHRVLELIFKLLWEERTTNAIQ
jgi:hypothetical protein